MKQLSSVVWSEGMHLGPHHFQTQSRYFEDSSSFISAALRSGPYGLTGIQLDEDALINGVAALLHARGIFPDGLPFDMPDYDALPPARNIMDAMSPVHHTVVVHLAIPRKKTDGVNVAAPNGNAGLARYVADSRPIADENTGRDEKAVQFGRKNARLLLENELSDEWETLPVARVKRGSGAQLEVDRDFVPPCLRLAGSPRLMAMLGRLIEILEEKSLQLSAREQAGWRSVSEVMSFWLRHSICSSLPVLRHLYFTKHGHPEELHLVLSQLAGALCTFGMQSDVADLPVYSHSHPEEPFTRLDRHIRSHLEIIIPDSVTSIPIQPAQECFHTGAADDDRCFRPSRWILAVGSPAGSLASISKVPQLVKICSEEYILKLVQRALPGLPLRHLQTPPAALAPAPDMQYFDIVKEGPCWEHIARTRKIGIYVPAELPGPQLQLLVVFDA